MNSNDNIKLVEEILHSKIELFFIYEEITDRMVTCETEELSNYITKRQDIALQIDLLSQRLVPLYDQSGDNKLRQAALNELNYGECSDELKDVFLIGQKLASIVSRILRKEQQVIFHIETQKEILLNLIRQQNTGVTANAEKYYRTSKHLEDNITVFNNKY